MLKHIGWFYGFATGVLVAAALLVTAPAALAQRLPASDLPAAVAEVFYGGLASIGENPQTSGSGFLVSKDGHVLTAWHVLSNIRKNDPSSRTYIRSRYTVYFNREDGDACPATATLVGGSEFRDIAVLQVNPVEWRTLDCLGKLTPVRLDVTSQGAGWSANPSRTNDPRLHTSDVLDFVWPLGRGMGCLNPDASTCQRKGFDAWRTTLTKYQNTFGLIEVHQRVPAGFSGGPAVLEDGRVIGMMVAAGRENNMDKVEVVSGLALERPLWTFGISVSGSSVHDYVGDMHDILQRKAEIEEALEMLREMKGRFAEPQFIRDSVAFVGAPLEAYFVSLTFRKQLNQMPSPTQFTYGIECIPSPDLEPGMRSVLAEHRRTKGVHDMTIWSGELSEKIFDPDTGEFSTSIGTSVRDIVHACTLSLNQALAIANPVPQGKLTLDSITRLRITPTAHFADAEIRDRVLGFIDVDLPAEVWQH